MSFSIYSNIVDLVGSCFHDIFKKSLCYIDNILYDIWSILCSKLSSRKYALIEIQFLLPLPCTFLYAFGQPSLLFKHKNVYTDFTIHFPIQDQIWVNSLIDSYETLACCVFHHIIRMNNSPREKTAIGIGKSLKKVSTSLNPSTLLHPLHPSYIAYILSRWPNSFFIQETKFINTILYVYLFWCQKEKSLFYYKTWVLCVVMDIDLS